MEFKTIKKHPNFPFKSKILDQHFFLEVNRDGNCFYTTLALLCFYNENLYKKIINTEINNKKINPLVYECYQENLKENENLIKNKDFCFNSIKNDLIGLIKILISTEIQNNSNEYKELVLEDLESYCKKNIEPFYKRAGEIEIYASSKTLGIEIKIIDMRKIKEKNIIKTYNEGEKIKIEILHTEDHYEPLFKK